MTLNPANFLVKRQMKEILSLIKNQLPNETILGYKITVHKNLESVFLVVNEKQYELPGQTSIIKESILTLSSLYAKGEVIGAEIVYSYLPIFNLVGDEIGVKDPTVTGTFFTLVKGEKTTESVTI